MDGVQVAGPTSIRGGRGRGMRQGEYVSRDRVASISVERFLAVLVFRKDFDFYDTVRSSQACMGVNRADAQVPIADCATSLCSWLANGRAVLVWKIGNDCPDVSGVVPRSYPVVDIE